jgi:hypothetical protein
MGKESFSHWGWFLFLVIRKETIMLKLATLQQKETKKKYIEKTSYYQSQ